jgi:hypothetical protein
MALPTNLPPDFTAGESGHVEAHEATNVRVNAIATEVNAHEVATDPHGDRAYTDAAIAAVTAVNPILIQLAFGA